MRFEIPFNEKIYRQQVTLNVDLAWQKALKKQDRSAIICLIIFLFGLLIIYGKSNLGYLFVAMGMYGFLEFYKIRIAYKKNQKRMQQIVDKEIKIQTAANENSVWEFNEEYFGYKDCKYEAKIKWNTFYAYRLVEDQLFLDLSVGIHSSYVLGKEEVGEEAFQSILQLVAGKIKKIDS
ncbi:hypothetical protein [Flavobacterium sp.]|uniref:hypothetical protein n=1 Tax=Flavobacterium sp. TaxID=239 RepID=UPI002FD92B4A